jgi:hypothetical protein
VIGTTGAAVFFQLIFALQPLGAVLGGALGTLVGRRHWLQPGFPVAIMLADPRLARAADSR